MMNKGLAKLLIYSTVTFTVTIGSCLGFSIYVWEQISVAQEIESSFSGSRINGRLDNSSKQAGDGRYYNIYTLVGKEGEQLTIDLVSEEFDGYLILFDSEGNIIAEDDYSGKEQNAQIIITLPKIQTYVISVTSNQARELGEYALSWGRASTKDLVLLEAVKLDRERLKLYQQGRYTEAISLAEQVLAIRRKQLGNNHPTTANSLNNLALLYQAQGRYTEAESFFQQALAINQKQLGNNHPDIAGIFNNLALLYRLQGRYTEAEPLFQQALAIKRNRLGDNHLNTANSLNNLASLYRLQGRYTEAESFFQQALAIRRKQLGNNHPDTANSLNNLALLYQDQGRYTEAEPLFQQALAIHKEQLGKNNPSTATYLNNLASLHRDQGRYTEAELLYQQALAINKEELGENHPITAGFLNNLAIFYYIQGRYTEAEPLYQQALAIHKEQLGDNHPSTANSLNNLALLYQDQGKYTEAEPLYQQALAIHKEQLGDNHPSTANSLNNLALLYQDQRRYTEAEPLYQQALTIKREQLGENHPSIANSLNNLALLYQDQENINLAIEFLTQGIQVQEYNLSENLIAGSEQQKQDYIATISSTTNGVISLNQQSALYNQDTTDLALTTILQRKGRILDFLTNSSQIIRQKTDNPEIKKLLANYYSFRNQYSNLIFRKPKEIKSPDIHRQQLIELEKQTKQQEDQLSRRSAEFRELSEPVTLEKIQQLIPKDSALVELINYKPFNPQAPVQKKWGKPRYAAYILHSEGSPQAIDLGEAEAIDKAVDQFRKTLCTTTETTKSTIENCIKNLPIERVKASAQKLDQMVMQPVRQLLGDTKNILLSPDSKLNLVPFEALVDENNEYLVKNYNFTYLTSGRDLIRLQQKSPSEELPLVFADPLYNEEFRFSSVENNPEDNLVASNIPLRSIEDISELFNRNSFPPLEETKKEAEAIQSLLDLPSERIKLQSQASETRIKQVQSPQILHIATHGFFLDKPSETNSSQATSNQINSLNNLDRPVTNDNPLFRSGLVLAGVESRPSEIKSGNDGVFTAYEATFLDLVGTKLVVLSACDTGVGDITTGEGIYGLRRALVIAGSESQLISLWKVVDEGTKDLMKAYYEKLKQGEGRTTALHKVQKQMLRGELKGEKGQSYEHPYYWASFIPSGDWTPMEFSNSQ